MQLLQHCKLVQLHAVWRQRPVDYAHGLLSELLLTGNVAQTRQSGSVCAWTV